MPRLLVPSALRAIGESLPPTALTPCGAWSQSSPRKGWTYCSAMSQGKKIQVSWLTSVT